MQKAHFGQSSHDALYFGNAFKTGNNASSLEVQVRTTKVGDANATGFTAFAIKEGNSQVIQVNLNATTSKCLRNILLV